VSELFHVRIVFVPKIVFLLELFHEVPLPDSLQNLWMAGFKKDFDTGKVCDDKTV
jgi:hypothetical protein